MAGLRVHFVFPAVLVERVDACRGDVSRGEFVRRAVERALSEAKEPTKREQADPGSVPSSEGVRSAAPAQQPLTTGGPKEVYRGTVVEAEERERQPYRQHVPGPNVEGIRSSSQAKRDVAPVPKRGEKK